MRSFKNISSDLNEQVPNEWEVTKLNLIANLRRGPFGGALKVDSFVSEGYAVYEQQHAIHKKLSNIRYFIDEKKYKEMRVFKVEENDILLSCSGTIGESVIIPTKYKEGIINQALLRIRLIRPDINIGYFKYFMDSFLFQTLITDNSHGSAMKNIASMNVINKIPVPVPSEDEQEKIVLILNWKLKVLDRTIDMKYKVLELLDQQRQSIITEAVTKGLNPNVKMKDSGVEWIGEIPEHWALNKIKYCVNLLGEKAEEQTTLQYLGLENIESKTGRYIPTEDVEIDGSAIKFFKGNVLFGKLRPYLTKVLLAEFNGRCSTEILVLETLSSIINNAYLKNLLLTPNFIDEINSSTYGSKMPRANWSFIGNTLIPLPPLSEQEVIVKEIMEVDKRYFILISKLKNQIEKLKEYRQSLIYEAVTGKIDVRDMELD